MLLVLNTIYHTVLMNVSSTTTVGLVILNNSGSYEDRDDSVFKLWET